MYANKSTIEKKRTDLADYMTKVIVQLKKEKKYAAKHTYASTRNSFMKFSGGEGTAMPTSVVFMPGRLKEYEGWLRGWGKSWNTVSTYMRTLQAVYNRLYPPGSRAHNPTLFDNVYTKVESQTKRALTEEQMQVLTAAALRILPEKKQDKLKTEKQKNRTEKKEAQPQEPQQVQEKDVHRQFPIPENLHRPLAYFLIMFLFRGMPFIDLAYLRKNDVKGNLLVYHRHKTGKQMTVEITSEAAGFLEAFRDESETSPYLFPVLDSTLTDDAEVYADYLHKLRCFNSDLEKLAELLFSGLAKISSYTARHTWATLMFHMGIPVGIICEALGHSSIRVTETYLKPFENEKVDKANKKLISGIMKCKGGNPALCRVM